MKRKNKLLRIFSLVLCVMMLICIIAPAEVSAADGDSVSDLALAQGEEGVKTLEDNGYTVMGRPLTGDYRLGYKKGGSAVTGLVVSYDNSDTVNVNGIVYQRVGSLGETGNLYLTRDASAGAAVLSFGLQSSEEYADKPFYALRNDGTVPMLRDSGEPCNLGSDGTAYLFLLKDNVFRPYIKSVTAVAGDGLRSAIGAAAAAGCERYYDPGLRTEDGKTVVIGYTRTTEESEAITCIAAGAEAPALDTVAFEPAGEVLIAGETPYRLFQTRDRTAGNPVLDLTGSAVPVRSSDRVNKWAEKVFVKFNTSASSVNQVKSDNTYKSFLKDGDALTNVPVLIPSAEDNIVTPLAYVCSAEGQPENIFPVSSAQTPEETETAETELPPEETETAEEKAAETDGGEYTGEQSETMAAQDETDGLASVFGGGNLTGLIIIIVLAVIGAAGIIAALAVRNKKRKGGERRNDKN